MLFFFVVFQFTKSIVSVYSTDKEYAYVDQSHDDDEKNSKESAEEKEFKYNITDINYFNFSNIFNDSVSKKLHFYLLKDYNVNFKISLLPPQLIR